MGKTVESLIMEFDQAKYEDFLSSGSKSPRARQYRKVSFEICSQVPSETSPKMACVMNIIAGSITHKVCVNVSHETCEANIVEGQFSHALSLSQLQVIGASQKPMKRNQNTERQQRRRARR